MPTNLSSSTFYNEGISSARKYYTLAAKLLLKIKNHVFMSPKEKLHEMENFVNVMIFATLYIM